MRWGWVAPGGRAPEGVADDDVEVFGSADVDALEPSLDAVVLDSRAFAGTSALLDGVARVRSPLVIWSDAAVLDAILDELPPKAEVCLRDASARLLRRRVEQAIARERAVADRLTGLMVRGRFLAICEERVEVAAPHRPVSVAIIDLDHFKAFNDREGHATGDRVLIEWARRVEEAAGASAMCARMGGEEYGILLDSGEDEAAERVEAVLQATRATPFTASALPVTASAGLATVTAPLSCAELLRQVDEALYAAKADGRDRLVTFEALEREAAAEGDDVAARSFENMTRVISERVAQVIARRGRRLFRELRQEADVDALTGLFNRRYLDRRLDTDLEDAQRADRPFTFALLDVDHFGRVNKEHGWPVGDRVLQSVAGRARSCLDSVGWVARYGGEEIALVFPDAALDDAAGLLESLRRAIESDAHGVRGGSLSVTVSVGAAQARASDDAAAVLERCSDALREAKDGGRNRVCTASD